MKFKNRLKTLEKCIELTKHKSGHLIVNVKLKGIRFKRLTNIKSNVSKAEQAVIRVEIYKIIDSYWTIKNTHKTVKEMVSQLNYATCLGSPWLLQERGPSD